MASETDALSSDRQLKTLVLTDLCDSVELTARIGDAAAAELFRTLDVRALQLLQRWKDLIDHTQIHFDNEDKWMRDTNFAASNCHTTHHKAVLDVMREGLNYGLKGHFVVVRKMNAELATWFPQHADTMDAALSDYLKRIGYDTVTGHIAHPQAMPEQQIHGCSGSTDTDLTAGEQPAACGH